MLFVRNINRLVFLQNSLNFDIRYLAPGIAMSVRRVAVFHANPSFALVDEKTKYNIEGLQSSQKVTVVAILKEEKATFISHAHYVTDSCGCVDLANMPSLGGSFTGKESMGILWSMKPEKGSRTGLRLMKKDPATPFNIQFHVIDGFQNITAAEDINEKSLLCSGSQQRTYMAPGVKRIWIKQGRLRGALFLPAGEGPFPGVIDLFGTAGGIIQFRSALLASRGFASFAQAYFGYDDLNSKLNWDMECFEEAVDFMTTHDQIKPGGIGAIGVSKGTELINYMAIHSPLLKAVVCIGPYHYYSAATHKKDGVTLPVAWPALQNFIFDPEGLVIGEAYWKAEVPEETLIEIEKAKGAEFLFINGEDDKVTYPAHTELLIQRLLKHGKKNYTWLRYPGAGHLIEPPYTPHCRIAYHKIFDIVMFFGGNTRDHAYAQEDSWRNIIAFFKRHLQAGDQNDVIFPSSKL